MFIWKTEYHESHTDFELLVLLSPTSHVPGLQVCTAYAVPRMEARALSVVVGICDTPQLSHVSGSECRLLYREMDLGYSLKPNPMEPCLTAGSHLQKVPQPFRKHQWLKPKAPTHEYPHCWYSFTQLHNLRIQLCSFFGIFHSFFS